MNLHVTGHHLDVTPAIHTYLSNKLERITRHFDNVIDISVIMSVEKIARKVEASVRVRGRDIFAQSNDPDMYAAIDSLVDKLDRQIVKHKEKRSDSRGDPVAKLQTPT